VDKIIESLNLHELRGNSLESRKIRSDNTNVSGGERQRIAIGRAKYFDENIVVLDEPTSALDAKNKSMITKYLNQISKTKTIIIITHDLDLIAIADKVLILEKGKAKYYGSREKYKNETK
jgi:ABC-type bacteriocin/lantibiotic exporter with double-glycine peptidase domain